MDFEKKIQPTTASLVVDAENLLKKLDEAADSDKSIELASAHIAMAIESLKKSVSKNDELNK